MQGLFGGKRASAARRGPIEPARDAARPAHDIATPAFAAAGPAPPPEGAPRPDVAPLEAPPGRGWVKGWHPAISDSRRHLSPNVRLRKELVSAIVIHVAGTDDFADLRRQFLKGTGSAHYVVDKDGALHQFASEHGVAFHANMEAATHALMRPRDGSWRRYKRYFPWHGGYPADARLLDATLRPTRAAKAHFAARADDAPWPDYAYFDARWGARALPLHYRAGVSPNENTIGVELVTTGGPHADGAVYTDAMYATLSALLQDLCARHNLKRERGVICGHEDVDPVARWGWDPNHGFDWARAIGA